MQLLYVGHLWMSFVFLKLCNAQDIQCNITQEGGQTLYSVPEFKAAECQYQWLNITNHVLANQGKITDDQVVMKSSRTLLTYKCSNLIRYNRDCISEGMKRTATCVTNCSGNAGLQINGEIQTNIPRNHWTVTTAAITFILLLLGLLCYKLRDDVCRKLRGLYTSVKTEINGADLEGQHG